MQVGSHILLAGMAHAKLASRRKSAWVTFFPMPNRTQRGQVLSTHLGLP